MIKLYTTDCPLCSVLKTKLNQKNLSYEIISNKDVMVAEGIKHVPVLEVDGNKLNYGEALEYLKGVKNV